MTCGSGLKVQGWHLGRSFASDPVVKGGHRNDHPWNSV